MKRKGYKYATGKIKNRHTTRYHKTLKESEARLARVEKKDPVGLHRGDYYLDPLSEC
jgi:hypothetical protein